MATEDAPERMRIAASLRGATIALVQPNLIAVLELPDLKPVAEIGISGDIDDHDVGYVEDTGRLAILGRAGATSTLHIVDPTGPTKLGELEYRAPARIEAIAGDHVLVSSNNRLSVIDASVERLVQHTLPVRGNFTVGGRLGPDLYVLAVSGALEEWDANKRAPGRRLRLDQALDPLFVGGNAQQIWMVARQRPDVVDVINLAGRTTRRTELPEPIALATQHPSGTLLAVIGAESRNAFVVDLTRSKSFARVDGGAMTTVTWLGLSPTLLIKPIGGPLELVTTWLPPEYESMFAATPELSRSDDAPAGEPSELVVDSPPAKRPEPTKWTREDIASRLAAWREKHAGKAAWTADAIAEVAKAAPGPIEHPAPPASHGGWRAELAQWAMASATHRTRPAEDGLDAIAQRLGLADSVRHAVALLYGAYLAGTRISAFALADALGWDWKEALGAGALADTELVQWRPAGGIRLCRELIAALDERPPLHGTIAPAGRTAVETVAIVAPAEIDPLRVATWAAPSVGALLVPDERGRRRGRAFVREARIRGVTPLVPWTDFAAALRVPPQPGAVVVEHAATAASLQLPVVATWSA